MKSRQLVAILFVLLLALPGTLAAQEPDLESLARSVPEALNAGDIEAALAVYAEDGVLDLGPFGKFSGKEELRASFENELSLNAEWQVDNFQVDGNTVTFTSRYTSDAMKGLGVTLEAVETMTFEDGVIVLDQWMITDESFAEFQAATASLPETGGETFPLQGVLLALGGLAVTAGAGTGLLRRRHPTPGRGD
jgi:hypothetical protein